MRCERWEGGWLIDAYATNSREIIGRELINFLQVMASA